MSPVDHRHAEISQYRLGLSWELAEPLWQSTQVIMQGYAELAIGQWRSHLDTDTNHARVVNQTSASPVLRVTSVRPLWGAGWPFFELGAGAGYQTEEDIEQHQSGINMGGHTGSLSCAAWLV